MSGYVKGTRKPKRGLELRDINVGGIKIKPAVAIVSLMAALYMVFLIGAKLESGLDAMMLPAFSFAVFAALAYLARHGRLAGLKPFALLIDAFLVLSALSLVQASAGLLDVFGPAEHMTARHLTLMMNVSAAAAAISLMAVLYFEKEGRENIYLKASPLRSALMGFAVMAACGLAAIGSIYLFGGGRMSAIIALNILAFGLFGGVYEEALYRGLLLSRLRQVLGKNHALAIQAVVFSVFEALAVYAFIPSMLVLPAVLVAGALIGYYLGMITLKNESILAPQLIHAGLYMLLAIPLFLA